MQFMSLSCISKDIFFSGYRVRIRNTEILATIDDFIIPVIDDSTYYTISLKVTNTNIFFCIFKLSFFNFHYFASYICFVGVNFLFLHGFCNTVIKFNR